MKNVHIYLLFVFSSVMLPEKANLIQSWRSLMCTLLATDNVQMIHHGNRGLLFSYLNWSFHTALETSFFTRYYLCFPIVGFVLLNFSCLPFTIITAWTNFTLFKSMNFSSFSCPWIWLTLCVLVCWCLSSSLWTVFSLMWIWEYDLSLPLC